MATGRFATCCSGATASTVRTRTRCCPSTRLWRARTARKRAISTTPYEPPNTRSCSVRPPRPASRSPTSTTPPQWPPSRRIRYRRSATTSRRRVRKEVRERRAQLKREAKQEIMVMLDNTPLRHSRDVTGPHLEIRKPSATLLRTPPYNAKSRPKSSRCTRKPRSKAGHVISAIAPPPRSTTRRYLEPAVEVEKMRSPPPLYVNHESPQETPFQHSSQQFNSPGSSLSESPVSTPSKRGTSHDPMEIGSAQDATAQASESQSLSTISPISPPRRDVVLGPGAFVLAKCGGYSHWPGRVNVCSLEPWVGQWRREYFDGEVQVWVVFLNSYTGEWCFQRNVVEFTQRNVAALCENGNGEMDEDLKGAVEEAFDRIEELRSEEVVNEELHVGEVVLAKYDEYPPWPAVIKPCGASYGEEEGQWRKEDYLHCYFLGEENKENWVERHRVRRFSARRAASTRVRRNNVMYEDYMRAVEEANRMAVKVTDSEESATKARRETLTDLNYGDLRRQLME